MAALSIVAVDDQCERRLLGWVLELGAKIDHVIPYPHMVERNTTFPSHPTASSP